MVVTMEITVSAIQFLESNGQEAITPMEAGTKNKAMFPVKKRDTLRTSSALTMPLNNERKSKIIPNTLPGTNPLMR